MSGKRQRKVKARKRAKGLGLLGGAHREQTKYTRKHKHKGKQ